MRLSRFPDCDGASAPAAHPIGYDNKASAHRLAEERHHVFPTDYPVLFWLAHLIGENTVLFDLGGNVGSRYLAFRNHLTYRDSLRWIVSEVPAVVELGREIAARENAPHLDSTHGLRRTEPERIFCWRPACCNSLTTGSASLRNDSQSPAACADQSHAGLRGRVSGDAAFHWHGVLPVPHPPSTGPSSSPRSVDLGYRLVDEWANPGIGCYIPQHHSSSIDAYSGFYFVHSGA